MMSIVEHARIHGLTAAMVDEMSIRREIIYELAKKIPVEQMSDVIAETMEKIQNVK